MKNLKYIFALSSVFVSLFALSYNVDLVNSSSNQNKENSNQDNKEEINEIVKQSIIDSYNSSMSNNHSLNLKKGNLLYRNNNKPVNLDFSGLFSITNNSLNSYAIDASYSYDSNTENFKVTSGNLDYSSITYDDNVYLFSSQHELSAILSFMSSQDSKYPSINLNYKFSTIFDSFLNINESSYKVYSSLNGYSFINDDIQVTVDQNYNLVSVKSNTNSDLTYSLYFDELDSSLSSSKAISNSEDFVSTFKGLLNDNDFDISYNAEIKSSLSNNLKYNGFITSSNDSLSLNVNEYINNNLQNNITSTFKDENIYFNIFNGKEKGNLIDSEVSDLVSATSGLMSTNSEFDVSFSTPLNALINTNIFQNIVNLDLTSSDIKDLKESTNLKTFKINSKAFGFTSSFDIRFELELLNTSLKSISIKDFKTNTSNVMNVKFDINKLSSNKFSFNEESYPIYNSLLPYYKKVIFIINEMKLGGNFTTSIVDKDSQQILGLSTKYDLNLGKSINNISLDNISAALTDLKINFNNISDDTTTTSSLVNSLFLQNTLESSNSTFALTIKSLNYKNKKFYILLEDEGTESKYTLENSSLKTLISSAQKLSGTMANTNKGFDLIKKEIDGISKLVKNIGTSTVFINIKNEVKNGKFTELGKYVKLDIQDKSVSVTLKLKELITNDSVISDSIGYSSNSEITLKLAKDTGNLVSLDVSDINIGGSQNKVSNTSLGLNSYDEKNMLDDDTIKNDWDNEEGKENKSKDLNQVLERISDVIDAYNKYSLKSSSISNLINIDFAYKDLSFKGNLSTILHFDDSLKLDEKYFELNIPFNFSNKTGLNDVAGVDLSLVYSDKDSENSKLNNLVYDKTRLYKGTQVALGLNYGSEDHSSDRNSTLYAYSSNQTLVNAIEAVSKIEGTNVLVAYNTAMTIKNLTTKIVEAVNKKDSNLLEELSKSGIISISTLMKLLNFLDSSGTSLDINLDLSKITKDETLKDKVFYIKLNLDTKVDSEGKKTISIKSVDVTDNNNELKLNLNIAETIINADSTSGTSATKISKDIIPSTFQSASTEGINYIDMQYLANLIELGVTTTNKKYQSLSGTFGISDTITFKVAPLNIDDNLNKIQPINALKFTLNLEFVKDEDKKPSKIKSYLSINKDGDTNNAIEFLIEQADGGDLIYINEYSDTKNTTSFMKKETMLGKVHVKVTENDEDGNPTVTKSGDVPRILYYLLDLSNILKDNISTNYSVVDLDLDFKDVMLSTIFDMMIKDETTTKEGSDSNDSTKFEIDYLNGWDIKVEKENNLISGYFEADLTKLLGISELKIEDLATLSINSNIKLAFKQTSTGMNITLGQSNTDVALINFDLNYGDIALNLTVSLNTSKFTLTSSNTSSIMNRYDSIISNFKSSDAYRNSEQKYVTEITCPEIIVEYTFPTSFKIYSYFSVSYNNESSTKTSFSSHSF